MELQRIVWHWDALVTRFAASEEGLSAALNRSCRPLEAERSGDGTLTLVLGSWWAEDLAALRGEVARTRLERGLGRMLEDRLHVVVAPWPGGLAQGPLLPDGTAGEPDLFAGLPPEAREEAALCESPIQRYFLARARQRNLRPRCQYLLGRYRLDFAFPQERVAVEVVGWEWHKRRGTMPREREEQLGIENWRARWFAGAQVVEDVERCLDDVQEMLVGSQGLTTRRFQARGSGPTGLQQWPRYQRRPSRR